MPRLANVAEVIVMVYFGDHPPPHVHARMGRPKARGVAEARFAIDDGAMIDGMLPARQARQVSSWCRRNRGALLEDWERAQEDRHPVGRYD